MHQTKIKYFLYFNYFTEEFQDAYIAGKKVFWIKSDAAELDWQDYGFKIVVPEGAVSPLDTVKVHVTALVGGEFILPENTELVSAVYAISVSKPLLKRVQLVIQHCVSIETSDHIKCLSFATAQDHQSPYQFQPVHIGKFFIGERCGSISITNFSLWSIIMKNLRRLLCTDRKPTQTDSEPLPSPEVKEEMPSPPLQSPSHSTAHQLMEDIEVRGSNTGMYIACQVHTNYSVHVGKLPDKHYFGQVIYEDKRPEREWLMRFLLCKDLNALIKVHYITCLITTDVTFYIYSISTIHLRIFGRIVKYHLYLKNQTMDLLSYFLIICISKVGLSDLIKLL